MVAIYPNFTLSNPIDSRLYGLKVSYLLREGDWDTPTINSLFPSEVAVNIL